jgi:hypothetical protein
MVRELIRAGRGWRLSGALCLFTVALMVFSTNGSAGYTWTISEPDANAKGFSHGMALDASGNPGIGYVDESYDTKQPYTDFHVKFAKFNGNNWAISTVATGCMWSVVSVAYNKAGNPSMAFGGRLATYEPNQGIWTLEKFDKKGGGFYSVSLAYDANGYASISYMCSGLKFAQKSSSGLWTTTMIDSGATGLYTSLAFDNSGKNAAIAYPYDANNDGTMDSVKCARYDSVSKKWATGIVEGALGSKESAYMVKVAYSSDGNPTILCHKIIDGKTCLGIIHWDSANNRWGAFDQFYILGAQEWYNGLSLVYSGSTPFASYDLGDRSQSLTIVKISYKTDSGWVNAVVDSGSEVGGWYTHLKLDGSGAPKLTFTRDYNTHYAVGAAG